MHVEKMITRDTVTQKWEPKYENVLDHGFVGLIDFMGNDQRIVDSARVSYGAGTSTVRNNRGLIRYLMRHHHCYDGSNMVLTSSGYMTWEDAYEIKTGYEITDPERDSPLQVVATNGTNEWLEDVAIDRFDYDGVMYTVSAMTTKGMLFIDVTEDHRMVIVEGSILKRVKVTDLSGVHYVRLTDGSKVPVNFDNMYTRHHSGYVYCATVSTGMLMVRGSKTSPSFICGNSTPFESVEFQFHIKAPIMVLRQWMRHRTSCISSDTNVIAYVDDVRINMSMKNLFTTYHSGVEDIFLESMTSDGEYQKVRMKDIWHSGKKDVHKLIAGDTPIETSIDHRFYTKEGWLTLKEIKERHDADKEVLLWKLDIDRPYLEPVQYILTETEFKDVYDLEVDGELHAFSANTFIVHNSYNEYSGRYSIMEDDFYVPKQEHVSRQANDSKQGREKASVSDDSYEMIRDYITSTCEQSYQAYQQMVGERDISQELVEGVAYEQLHSDDPDVEGVIGRIVKGRTGMEDVEPIARELARMVLPLNIYSQMYWKINLKNLMHFLWLRSDSHAQYEIRVYADMIADMIQDIVPLAMEAYEDYQAGAVTLSRMEKEVMRSAMRGNLNLKDRVMVSQRLSELGASDREIKEFFEIGDK